MRIYQVDAFTSEPFAGNPAAVCILENDRPDTWKQNVAAEMNLSETAFALSESEGFLLRWFTPQTEVSLCGHATLATAHVLWEQGIVSPSHQARFRTLRSGLLSAVKRENWIEMDFPAIVSEQTQELPGLAAALGAKPLRCHIYREKRGDMHLAELESEETVRNLRPDLAALQRAVAGIVL
jgi:predicted PhzF superfamily epimerase YddE/YHI9